jgi:tetraacyldisaccharide 4'-kinase
MKGRRIAAFSGIATPESFERFLHETGAHLVHVERFLDHYRFTAEDLADLYAAAAKQGAEFVVTTEKDAVRIAEKMPQPMPLYYLRLEIEILRGADDFEDAVGKICFPLGGSASETKPT